MFCYTFRSQKLTDTGFIYILHNNKGLIVIWVKHINTALYYSVSTVCQLTHKDSASILDSLCIPAVSGDLLGLLCKTCDSSVHNHPQHLHRWKPQRRDESEFRATEIAPDSNCPTVWHDNLTCERNPGGFLLIVRSPHIFLTYLIQVFSSTSWFKVNAADWNQCRKWKICVNVLVYYQCIFISN